MDPFISEIRIFGCNFAPVGWALCQGQLLSIQSNTALFSLLGTFYGGNGVTNFGLPDLRSRAAVGQGQGPGLTPYSIGETGGSETVTLLSNQLAVHSHNVNCYNADGSAGGPGGNILASSGTDSRGNVLYNDASSGALVSMNAQQISLTGNGLPHNNMSPYLTLNFCIALTGVYPQRN